MFGCTREQGRAMGIRAPRVIWRQVQSWAIQRLVWPEADYLIHPERKFIYCPIAKVACSSIKAWLLTSIGERAPKGEEVHNAVQRCSLRHIAAAPAWRLLDGR